MPLLSLLPGTGRFPIGVPIDVPIILERDDAARLARIELASPAYAGEDEPWVQRVIRWLFERVGELLDRAAGTSPLGWFGLLGIAVLVVLVVVVVRRRTGALHRSASPDLFSAGGFRSAEQYRGDAERFAASGAWAEAVRARLRAVVRDLEDRGLVDVRPGRTADEVARDAGRVLPAAAADLRVGARIFDDIWYGGRPADPAAYRRIVEVDAAVTSARPAAAAHDAGFVLPR